MNDASPLPHDKFRAYRARKKARGLREVRLWLPDLDSAAFQREAKRQATLLDRTVDEREATAMMGRLANEAWDSAD